MGQRFWPAILLVALVAQTPAHAKNSESSSAMTMSGMMLPHSAVASMIKSQLPQGDYLVSETALLTSSSVVAAADQSSTLKSALSNVLQVVQAHSSTMPSFLEEMTYLQEMFSLFPSLIPAESQIAESIVQSPSVVEELSEAATKPMVTDLSGLSSIQGEHPSLVDAFDAVTRAEVSFPEVTTVQENLLDVMQSDPSIISQFKLVNSMLTTALARMTTIVVNIPCIDAENEVVNYASVAELTPSLYTYVGQLQAMELSSPSLRDAENQIDTALLQNPSIVREISEAYSESASATNLASLSSVEQKNPTLVSCFETVVSAEITNPELSYIQPVFDQAVLEDPSLFLRQSTLVDRSSPSLFSAEKSISEVVQSHPSIVTDINYVQAVELSTPTLVEAESALEPGSIKMQAMSSSAAPMAVSIPSGDMQELMSVEESHPDLSNIQNSIEDAEDSVPSILSDVSEVDSAEASSLIQAESYLEKGEVTTPLLLTEVSYIDEMEVSYPSWVPAETEIEASEEQSPSAVTQVKLYLAGSNEADDTGLGAFVASHSTLLSALKTIDSLTDSSLPLARMQDTVESAEQSVPYLLTVVSRIMMASSPSEYAAFYELKSAESHVTSVLSDLAYIQNIGQLDSSLIGANSDVAKAEALSPSIASAVDADLEAASDQQAVPASIQTAVGDILQAEKSFPSLASIETGIVAVEKSDSTLMTDYTEFNSVESRLAAEVLTVPAVVCTVMIPNNEAFE